MFCRLVRTLFFMRCVSMGRVCVCECKLRLTEFVSIYYFQCSWLFFFAFFLTLFHILFDFILVFIWMCVRFFLFKKFLFFCFFLLVTQQEVLEARIAELEDALARLYDKFNQVSFYLFFLYSFGFWYYFICRLRKKKQCRNV